LSIRKDVGSCLTYPHQTDKTKIFRLHHVAVVGKRVLILWSNVYCVLCVGYTHVVMLATVCVTNGDDRTELYTPLSSDGHKVVFY